VSKHVTYINAELCNSRSKKCTELRRRFCSTPASWLGDLGFKSRPGNLISRRRLRCVPQSLQAVARIVPVIRLRLFPSTSFTIYYLLVIPIFDVTYREIFKASLNNPYMKRAAFCIRRLYRVGKWVLSNMCDRLIIGWFNNYFVLRKLCSIEW
jgi:hypothetical protein